MSGDSCSIKHIRLFMKMGVQAALRPIETVGGLGFNLGSPQTLSHGQTPGHVCMAIVNTQGSSPMAKAEFHKWLRPQVHRSRFWGRAANAKKQPNQESFLISTKIRMTKSSQQLPASPGWQ